MKRVLTIFAVFALSGCWGTWSNADLEYVNALPTKETLEAQLNGTTTQPLSGASTRQQGLFGKAPLNVGDPSESYQSTSDAVKNFNGLIDLIVGVVSYVETIPPTTRTSSARIWGPYPDSNHPGFDVRITVNKVDQGHFNYTFEWRKQAGGDFFSLVDGAAAPTANLHHGRGSITVHAQQARDTLGGWMGIDQVQIGYDTTGFPTAVDAKAMASNDGGTLEVAYEQAQDSSGKLGFAAFPDPTLTNGAVIEVDAKSVWLTDGSGRQDGVVTQGSWTGAHGTECWSTAHAVTYQRYWDGTEHGDAGTCIPGF